MSQNRAMSSNKKLNEVSTILKFTDGKIDESVEVVSLNAWKVILGR